MPGQILIKRTSSLAYWALNLATAAFSPVLLMVYAAARSMLNLEMSSKSACPLDMAITFLAWPLSMRGVKRLNRWMFPITLTLKHSSKFCSSSSGWFPLIVCQSFHGRMDELED